MTFLTLDKLRGSCRCQCGCCTAGLGSCSSSSWI